MIAVVFGKPKEPHSIWDAGSVNRAFAARHALLQAGIEGYVQTGTLEDIRAARHDFADASVVPTLPVRLEGERLPGRRQAR